MTSTLLQQDIFPVKVELLEKNPYGDEVIVNNILLIVGKPMIIYTQDDLNKFEPIVEYIDVSVITDLDSELDYDNIDDDMSSDD